MKFEFGGDAAPDIACFTDPPFHIEVTSRARDDVRALHDQLQRTLIPRGVHVTLTMPRRLAIPALVRKRVCDGIVAEIDVSDGRSRVTLEDLDGIARIEESADGTTQVTLDIGASLTDHMAEVDRALLEVVARKTQQAERGGWSRNTLLLIDASRLGMAWLRPEAVWNGLLSLSPLDWSSTPFAGIGLIFPGLQSTPMRGVVVYPALYPASTRDLLEVLTALRFDIPSQF
jgi:hypothetical protein